MVSCCAYEKHINVAEAVKDSFLVQYPSAEKGKKEYVLVFENDGKLLKQEEEKEDNDKD